MTTVVAGLARLVALDGGALELRGYDERRRALEVVLADGGRCAVGTGLVAAFLTEALWQHGIRLGDLRVAGGG